MKKALHTVFFDVGGTLALAPDLHDVFLDEWDGNVPKQSFYESLFQIKNEEGAEFRDVKTILTLLSRRMTDKYGVKDLSTRAAEIYRSVFLDSISLCRGVIELLSFLKERNVSLIIVSDADADVLRPQLQKLEIGTFFDSFIISSEVGAYKPSDIMVSAVNKYCVGDRAGMLMVGDSRDDVLTADKLGIASILIDPLCKNINAFPHFTIPEFNYLHKFLEDTYVIRSK